jgi:hypothetical protein
LSAAPLDRRLFIGLSAAALAGCARTLARQASIAEQLLVDPDWSAYEPVLRDLVRVILPLDDPAFPKLAPAAIETRLVSMFPLETEPRFLGLQRALLLFDHVGLFPIASAPLVSAEDEARDGANVVLSDDRPAYEAFARAHDVHGKRFVELQPDAQRAYFELWGHSDWIVKRAFHATMRALVLMTVYSDEAMWRVIGYEGPLV